MKRSIPLSKIHAAARKALIAADAGYFSWPEQQQERFRATMNEQAQSRVDSVLLKEIFGISCSPNEAAEIWRDLPLSELNPLNWAKLLTCGIGDDYIFLNESMAADTSLLNVQRSIFTALPPVPRKHVDLNRPGSLCFPLSVAVPRMHEDKPFKQYQDTNHSDVTNNTKQIHSNN